MSSTQPSISLVIVTYAREARVISNMETLAPYRQHFSEVLIVDNGNSTTLATEAKRILSDKVKVIAPSENLGAVGRTVGILASRGDIVVTLDDDVQLPDPTDLTRLRELFSAIPNLGCSNFKILYDDGALDLSDWCHPRDPAIYADCFFDTTYISEGACAFRGNLVRSLGAYPLDLFIGQEGVALAARIMDAGYSVCYFPAVRVTHAVATEGRASGRQFYYNTRNIYWIAMTSYPWTLFLRTVLREWLTLFLFAIRNLALRSYVRGVGAALVQTKRLLRERRPVSASTSTRIIQLNRLKPSALTRVRRVLLSRTMT